MTVPHCRLARTRADLHGLTAGWPQVDSELKGGQLSTSHVAALVEVPFEQQAILHCTVTTFAARDLAEIDAHKTKQCELMTADLTPLHQGRHSAERCRRREVTALVNEDCNHASTYPLRDTSTALRDTVRAGGRALGTGVDDGTSFRPAGLLRRALELVEQVADLQQSRAGAQHSRGDKSAHS